MDFAKDFTNTTKVIKLVLGRRRYLVTGVVVGIIVFAALYYFLVAKVADNDIWISVMMSGAGYITFGIVSITLISALFGIYFSLVIFKVSMIRVVGGESFFGIIGGIVGSLGVGCPTCGAFVLGLIGAPLALMYLPFKGLELQVLGILILILSIYLIGKSIMGVCNLPKNIQ